MREGLARPHAPVNDVQKQRREWDPGELIPVEEREAEEGGRGAGVERGEAEAEVGQGEEQEPEAGF